MNTGRSERLEPIPGQPPSLIKLPKGCVFRPRCPYHHLVPGNRCEVERPELLPVTPDHAVRCHIDPPRRREMAAERLGVGVLEDL
jgi:peptide/nickel transport system ATP-binding protein